MRFINLGTDLRASERESIREACERSSGLRFHYLSLCVNASHQNSPPGDNKNEQDRSLTTQGCACLRLWRRISACGWYPGAASDRHWPLRQMNTRKQILTTSISVWRLKIKRCVLVYSTELVWNSAAHRGERIVRMWACVLTRSIRVC